MRKGIGSFSIADNAIVDEKDVSSNFFLDKSCIGQSKSLATVKFLRELNEDVKGHHDERVGENSDGEELVLVFVSYSIVVCRISYSRRAILLRSIYYDHCHES